MRQRGPSSRRNSIVDESVMSPGRQTGDSAEDQESRTQPWAESASSRVVGDIGEPSSDGPDAIGEDWILRALDQPSWAQFRTRGNAKLQPGTFAPTPPCSRGTTHRANPLRQLS